MAEATRIHLERAWQEAKPTDCTLAGIGIKGSIARPRTTRFAIANARRQAHREPPLPV